MNSLSAACLLIALAKNEIAVTERHEVTDEAFVTIAGATPAEEDRVEHATLTQVCGRHMEREAAWWVSRSTRRVGTYDRLHGYNP